MLLEVQKVPCHVEFQILLESGCASIKCVDEPAKSLKVRS